MMKKQINKIDRSAMVSKKEGKHLLGWYVVWGIVGKDCGSVKGAFITWEV